MCVRARVWVGGGVCVGVCVSVHNARARVCESAHVLACVYGHALSSEHAHLSEFLQSFPMGPFGGAKLVACGSTCSGLRHDGE